MSTQYLLERSDFALQTPKNLPVITAKVDGKVVHILTKADLDKILTLNKFTETDMLLQKPRRTGFSDFRFVTFKVRETFASKYQKQHADKIKDRINKIAENVRSIKLLQASNKQLNAEVKTLTALPLLKQEVLENLEKISKLKGVIDVKIENSTLLVYTSDIIMLTPKSKYNLGPKIIKIDLEKRGVQFAHATDPYWRQGKYVAPHISENGNACLGNISATVNRLQDTKEFFALTSVLISYLKSYANGGSYAPMVSVGYDKSAMYQCSIVK